MKLPLVALQTPQEMEQNVCDYAEALNIEFIVILNQLYIQVVELVQTDLVLLQLEQDILEAQMQM